MASGQTSPAWLRGARIVTAAEMRRLEQQAVQSGLSERDLQQNAARSLAHLAQQMVGPNAGTVVVLVGPGNNGRDAMLAGGHLLRSGYRVALYLGPRNAVEPAEVQELEGYGALLGRHSEEGDAALERLARWLDSSALAIDGLLGIGAQGALRPPLGAVARTLNAARHSRGGALQVLAVDVPSGIDADGGQVAEVAVNADVTAALGAIKAGTLRFPAAQHAGRVLCLPIGLEADPVSSAGPCVVDECEVGQLVPARHTSGHKGSFGKVLVVGGSATYLGAPLLAAVAAARAGCGLVALAVPPAAQQAAASLLPEATCIGPIEVEREPDAALATLREAVRTFDAVVLGPGLGRAPQTHYFVKALLTTESARNWPPFVVDADALNALSSWPGWQDAVVARLILTPHHGEMSRLSGEALDRVAALNWEIAATAAGKWKQVVVLKGPHTTIAAPDRGAQVFGRSNPALATAGTGDVLAGLIGSLMAQGLAPWDAARLGVTAHARAAERAIQQTGWRSLIASDVAARLPEVLAVASDWDS